MHRNGGWRHLPAFRLAIANERSVVPDGPAAESFELATRPLANPGASHEELEEVHGWTLHQLRHSLLTHEAEAGTSTPMLLARSRHASVRPLERYGA